MAWSTMSHAEKLKVMTVISLFTKDSSCFMWTEKNYNKSDTYTAVTACSLPGTTID